jgi:putative membrane protein
MIGLAALLADSGWDNHMGDWGAGWWIVMVMMMVAFWALVIFAVAWLVRSLAVGHHTIRHRDPVEVLDHRLASGEISVEEYRERRELLKEGGGSGAS